MRKYLELSLEQIIEQVRVDKLSSDDFCLYAKEDGELALTRSGYQIIQMLWKTVIFTLLM